MSKFNNNVSQVDDPVVLNKRGHIEQRAEWLYLIADEAQKMGHEDWEEMCRKGIYRCGCMRGAKFFGEPGEDGAIRQASRAFLASPNGVLFDREIVTVSDDEYEMRFHYCPLVNAWRKLTDDDAYIAKLCDIAMDGDRGMFSNLENVKFTLASTIAEGHDYCRILLTKTDKDKE